MARKIYYAMLVTGSDGCSTCEQNFYKGTTLASVRKGLAYAATAYPGLQTGIRSIHDEDGKALEAYTFSEHSGARWRKVPKESLWAYDLNVVGRRLATERSHDIDEYGNIFDRRRQAGSQLVM